VKLGIVRQREFETNPLLDSFHNDRLRFRSSGRRTLHDYDGGEDEYNP
jgi:hypothetical protein